MEAIRFYTCRRTDVGLYAAGGRCVLLAGADDVHRDQLDATVAHLVREADARLGERCPASGPAAPAGWQGLPCGAPEGLGDTPKHCSAQPDRMAGVRILCNVHHDRERQTPPHGHRHPPQTAAADLGSTLYRWIASGKIREHGIDAVKIKGRWVIACISDIPALTGTPAP